MFILSFPIVKYPITSYQPFMMYATWAIIVLLTSLTVQSSTNLQDCLNECGNDPALFTLASHRSFGGSQAIEAPFVGLLEILLPGSLCNFTSYCTASIISADWLITATHCLTVNVTKLKECGVDEKEYRSPADSPDNPLYVFPKHIKFYPGLVRRNQIDKSVYSKVDFYELKSTEKMFQVSIDLALIKLQAPLTFSKKVQKICLLRNSGYAAGKLLHSIGYGRITNDTLPEVGDELLTSETAMKVEKKLFSNEACRLRNPIRPGLICVGVHGKGSMNGDSGGPLILEFENKVHQIGVASEKLSDIWPTLNQANVQGDKHPDLFVNLTDHCNWISQITKGNATCQDSPSPMSEKCRNLFIQSQSQAVNDDIFGNGRARLTDIKTISIPHESICEKIGFKTCMETFSCRVLCLNATGHCVYPYYASEATKVRYSHIQYNSFGTDSYYPLFFGANGTSCGENSICINYQCTKQTKDEKLDGF